MQAEDDAAMDAPKGERLAAPGDARWRGLAFLLGTEEVLIASDAVAEVLDPPEPLTRIPGVPEWIQGVAAIRGAITLVVDLPRLLGVADGTTVPGRRLLLVRAPDSAPVGLLVADVLGTRDLDGEPQAAPAAEEPDLITAVRTCTVTGGQACRMLDVAALLRSEAFHAVHP